MVGFRTDPSPGYGENTINTFYLMERSEVLYDKMKRVCVLLMLHHVSQTLCVNLIIYRYIIKCKLRSAHFTQIHKMNSISV